jgi:hypothetical protein
MLSPIDLSGLCEIDYEESLVNKAKPTILTLGAPPRKKAARPPYPAVKGGLEMNITNLNASIGDSDSSANASISSPLQPKTNFGSK